MASKSCLVLLALLALSLLVLPGQGYLNQWYPVKNLNDPHVQSFAKSAVEEYNAGLNKTAQYNSLDYLKTVKGKYKYVELDAGKDFLLNIVAKKRGDGSMGNYQALIYVDTFFANSTTLIRFKRLDN
ncbi:hypothetical protein ACET3Z_032796 [Daucus carota]